MVARTENAPCTRASFTSSCVPRSSGSFKNIPASLVAVHAASAVDRIETIRFCISLLKPSPPPSLDLLVDQTSIVAPPRLGWDEGTPTMAWRAALKTESGKATKLLVIYGGY
jgi:hypothetical protein